MTTEPILDAETILTTAIRNALTPFVGTYNGRPKAYYQLAEQGAPKPLVVFQFQSDITLRAHVGIVGASALVTLRALAESAPAAQQQLGLAAPAMKLLVYAGYTLKATYVRSPIIPQLNGTHTSAHTWRVTIERNP